MDRIGWGLAALSSRIRHYRALRAARVLSCPSCERSARTKEHVWPKWLRERPAYELPTDAAPEPDRPTPVGAPAELQVAGPPALETRELQRSQTAERPRQPRVAPGEVASVAFAAQLRSLTWSCAAGPGG
jgi:hypothetical protein